MASVEGGVEIEEVAEHEPRGARQDPGRRHRGRDRREGPRDRRGREVPGRGRRPGRRRPAVKLWNIFIEEDALLVEVNPLVKTADGKIIALDGKVSLDENADFRQPEHEALEDKAAANPLEAAAKAKNLNYVKLDGEVGIIGNGAGLVMSHPRRRRVRR